MKKLFRLLFRMLLFVVFVIALVVVYNTLTFESKQINVAAVEKIAIDKQVVNRLTDVIRMPTVSYPDRIDTASFVQFTNYLDSQFVWVDSLLEKRLVNDYSILYKWQGKKQNLDPILLMGHIDVVPVDGENLKGWEVPPFSGLVKDGYIWGRGSLDDKVSIMGALEATELLLREGYQPERSIYLAFGHDEEIGGQRGAKAIAKLLEQQGVQLEYVLDEGSIIMRKALAGLEAPAALIGVAEKGYSTLTLSINLPEGGHSSMPPSESAIGILGKAISTLTESPLPAKMDGPVRPLLEQLGPEMEMPFKAVFANLWLFGSVVEGQLAASPSSNAMLRTTTAPTIIKGGFKENVLPSEASATVNFRILPGETIASTIAYVQAVIGDDRIKVEEKNATFSANPSKVSSTESFGFQVIQRTSKEIFPEVVAVPSLVIAGTDSRHYEAVSNHIYRFLPVAFDKEDLKRIHGFNERISVDAYEQMIRFYRQLMLNSSR